MSSFRCFEPETICEAKKMLLKYKDDGAMLIAGGTDVLVDIKKGRVNPKYLISLNKIPNLSYLIEDASGLSIGAKTTFREIGESKLIEEKYPILKEVAISMGTVQIRNMATVGGNICNALPSADLTPALVSLDSSVKIADLNVEKLIPLEEFFVGVRKTRLEYFDVMKEIHVERVPFCSGTAFLKYGRTSTDLAVVNTAVRLTLTKDGGCKEARIVIGGGIGPTIIRAKESETLLEGTTPDKRTIEEAAQNACRRFSCRPTSIRGSPTYKTEIAKVLVKRALFKAFERAKAGVIGENGNRSHNQRQ